MFTNMQSLYLTGVVVFGFLIAGIFNMLDNLVVQIILGVLFLLIVANLFMAKEDMEESKN